MGAVVLYECAGYTVFHELRALVSFNEETPLVGRYLGFDKNDLRYREAGKCKRHNASPLSLARFNPRRLARHFVLFYITISQKVLKTLFTINQIHPDSRPAKSPELVQL